MNELNKYEYDHRYEGVNYLEDWLMNLPESEWLYLNMLANTKELTEDQMTELAEIAIPMYCQEMELETLEYDLDFMRLMMGYLLTGIVTLSLKLKGLIEIDGPIRMYKDYTLKKTDKLDEYFRMLKEDLGSDFNSNQQ